MESGPSTKEQYIRGIVDSEITTLGIKRKVSGDGGRNDSALERNQSAT